MPSSSTAEYSNTSDEDSEDGNNSDEAARTGELRRAPKDEVLERTIAQRLDRKQKRYAFLEQSFPKNVVV
jgi:hypothetical protein